MMLAANWKLYVENHIDWMHLFYVHPSTLTILDHAKGERSQRGRHWVSYDPFLEGVEGNDLKILKSIPHLPQQLDLGAHFLFPNVAMATSSDHIIFMELLPETPESTKMVVRVYGVEGGDVDGFMEMFTDLTKGEDGAVIENIQRNIRNPRFQVGPITQSYERAISNFHDAYLEFVK